MRERVEGCSLGLAVDLGLEAEVLLNALDGILHVAELDLGRGSLLDGPERPEHVSGKGEVAGLREREMEKKETEEEKRLRGGEEEGPQ